MKVLAVENNPELLKLLTHLLEKEGFEPLSAREGGEGLAQFREHRPAIACLDILLEDMSGIEVCRQMRAADPDMPILLITSKSRAADVKEGMAAGATEYIIKPFEIVSLTAVMYKTARACLAHDAAAQDESFCLDTLKVYPGRLAGDCDGRMVDLNLREIGILRLFHSRPGQCIPTIELAPLCWKAQAAADSKAIDWQIRQLSKKIEKDPETPDLIRPCEGGYIWG